MFSRRDVLEELKTERSRREEKILEGALHILDKSVDRDDRIQQLLNGNKIGNSDFDSGGLDRNRCFTEDDIRVICVRFRMRFLPVKFFKGDIPQEAFDALRIIDRQKGSLPNELRILAPRRLFDLPDADADPLLFAPLGDGSYYLIHKWGSDMKWHRRIMAYPFESIENLSKTILLFAVLIALLTPNSIIVPKSFMADTSMFGYWGFHRIGYFFHVVILLAGFSVFLFFSMQRQLSDAEWNRKTIN